MSRTDQLMAQTSFTQNLQLSGENYSVVFWDLLQNLNPDLFDADIAATFSKHLQDNDFDVLT